MEIQPITQPLGIAGSQRVDAQRLGQQDFLMLMVEQMRQQNPLEALDNTDFVAQMAQFETLTVMNDIAQALLSLASVSELANASAARRPQRDRADPARGRPPERCLP